MRTGKRCACGLPLHYSDKAMEDKITQISSELGEYQPVQVGTDEHYLVQRHYIALHGLRAIDLPNLVKQGIVKRG